MAFWSLLNGNGDKCAKPSAEELEGYQSLSAWQQPASHCCRIAAPEVLAALTPQLVAEPAKQPAAAAAAAAAAG